MQKHMVRVLTNHVSKPLQAGYSYNHAYSSSLFSRSPNQAVPLDYDTDDFYLSRQSEIDDRLDAIEASSDAEMEECVKAYWTRHHGVVSCVNWEIFKGPDHMMGLIKCFDRRQLRGICERLIKNHR